jgi:hypothetical protein
MQDKNAVKTKMSHHACDILANLSVKNENRQGFLAAGTSDAVLFAGAGAGEAPGV